MSGEAKEAARWEVEPFGYRRWACFLYQGDNDKPVWGVFNIHTSSEKVARRKCQELYLERWKHIRHRLKTPVKGAPYAID